MLRWRLTLGTLIVATLLGLCWLDDRLDHATGVPGMALFPLLVVLVVLASREMLDLLEGGGVHPVPWVVYCGNLLVATSTWIWPLGCKFAANGPHQFSPVPNDWTLLAVAAGTILVFVAEMRRYQRPGGVTVNMAAAVFAIVYVGVLFGFLVQLRLIWGVPALLSLVLVVKLGDTGAYAVGRLIGRTQMAPGLSPGKTIEGAVGGVVFACLGSWAAFGWLAPRSTPWWGWIGFGLAVGVAGMTGDLAESLLKRDAARKDSSRWMPGFGGVLDILDSLLLAAPVGYLCWALGLVGGW